MHWELGSESGRQTDDARRSTSVPVPLTSSLLLGTPVRKAVLDIDDAHHGRLIGVSLPDGAHRAFEDLHDEADVAGITQRIRRLAARHFGHASRGFLHFFAGHRARDEAGLLAWLEGRCKFQLDLARANVNDTLVFERLFLAAFAVMAHIRTVFADKGYDAEHHRDLCHRFGAEPHIHKRGQPRGSGLGQRRWPVERSNAWVVENKHFALRYDRLGFIIQALLQSACIFLVASRLARQF